MAKMLYQMKESEENAFRQDAAFLFLKDEADEIAGNPTKILWYKDVNPCWDRMKNNKSKPSDEACKGMSFALKHRVCGSADLVSVYLQGSDKPDDHLLTFDCYVEGTHPDISEEERLTDMLMMRLKPSYSLAELCWLANNIGAFKKTAVRKRVQSLKPSARSASSTCEKSLAKSRLLKKIEGLTPSVTALNVVRYDPIKGVGLKTVTIPQLQGAILRYMVKPIPVVASNSEVYAHVLDVMYPNTSSTVEELDIKEKPWPT